VTETTGKNRVGRIVGLSKKKIKKPLGPHNPPKPRGSRVESLSRDLQKVGKKSLLSSPQDLRYGETMKPVVLVEVASSVGHL